MDNATRVAKGTSGPWLGSLVIPKPGALSRCVAASALMLVSQTVEPPNYLPTNVE